MSLHPDPVPEAMREVLVIGAVAGCGNDATRCRVNIFAGDAGFGCGETGILRFPDNPPHGRHLFGWLAEDGRAGDV